MNTPIIKISDDQNEITHESGVVTNFVWTNLFSCGRCVYKNRKSCYDIPCVSLRRDRDCFNGIFKIKQ